MQNMTKFLKYIGGSALLCLVSILQTNAQQVPLGSGYYQNPYLFNTALAGKDEGTSLNLAVRSSTGSMPGTPRNQALSAEHGFGKSGIGFTLHNMSHGSLRHTGGALGYAYHLQLSDAHRLHFGVAATLQHSRLDLSKVSGETYDPLIANYNDRRAQFDANFGLAYSSDRLLVEFSMADLIHKNKEDNRDLVNTPLFYSAVSYMIPLQSGGSELLLQPKVALRGIRGHDNVFDIGVNAHFAERFNVFALYHTSNNATAGFGVKLGQLNLTGLYTMETSSMTRYSGNAFEIALGWHIGR